MDFVGGGGGNDNWVYFFHVNDRFNELMRVYAANKEDVHILTFWDKACFFETPEDVGKYRKIRIDICDEGDYYDETHYNATGYEVLASVLRPKLQEVLQYV